MSDVRITQKPVDEGPHYQRIYVWQFPVRVFHWVNALCIAVLFTTGLLIAEPVFTSNGEAYKNFMMGRVRQIHFAAAWIFLVSFFLRIVWFWIGNEHSRSGFPYVWRVSWWKDLSRQAWDYLKLDMGHPHAGHNALAGLSYTIFVILLGWLQILTGLAIYAQGNPGGFLDSLVGWVIPIFGGPFQTQSWHHLFAWGFVVFVILHLYIVLLDARQYRNGLIVSMITGFKFRRIRKQKED